MANEAGAGCRDLGASLGGDTIICMEATATAGDVTAYRVQFATTPSGQDCAFSMQYDDDIWTYNSGTETGTLTDTDGDTSDNVCYEFVDGDHFTLTDPETFVSYLKHDIKLYSTWICNKLRDYIIHLDYIYN